MRSLQGLPGIGPSLAADLARLGYREPEDLTGEDPEVIFYRLEQSTGMQQDPLVLDAFRCACHSASSLENDRELVKPWAWGRLRPAAPFVAPTAPSSPSRRRLGGGSQGR